MRRCAINTIITLHRRLYTRYAEVLLVIVLSEEICTKVRNYLLAHSSITFSARFAREASVLSFWSVTTSEISPWSQARGEARFWNKYVLRFVQGEVAVFAQALITLDKHSDLLGYRSKESPLRPKAQ